MTDTIASIAVLCTWAAMIGVAYACQYMPERKGGGSGMPVS